jgi:crotonobetainyl-CoA:carnitine CoA-transferase CaiB-like acyl-CoA transferase
MTTGAGPFRDVRVLEVSTGTAGRTAGMLLADFGAEVARVVPAGDHPRPDDPRLLCWDRGKQLTRPGPGELAHLARSCDVLLTDAIPGELEPLGLDATTLRDRAPGMVHAWLPPYAVRGRW